MMKFEQRLQFKIAFGYIMVLVIGIVMVAILVHERERIREIEAESAENTGCAPRYQHRPPTYHPACHPRRERHRMG